MNKPFRAGLRVWLLALVLLAVLPLFLFSAYTVFEFGLARQEAIRVELLQRSEAAANAVNERLGTALGYLNALASSDAALSGDLPTLYEHARRVVAMNPEATAISLITAEGHMAFMTMRPFGAPALPTNQPDAARKVFETGRPVISGPFVGPVSGLPVAALGVPVFRDGRVAYCLRMVLKIESFNELLAEQRLPADWVASIVDARGVFVARTLAPEQFIGAEVPSPLHKAVQNRVQGIIDSETKEGIPVKLAVARVPGWDWTIAVGVPKETLNAPLWRSLALLIISGLAFTGLGAIAAVWLSRAMSRRVSDVVMASRAIQRGEPVPVPDSHIRELDEMGQALVDVHERGQQASSALNDVAAKQIELTAELQQARCDALTGLPGRARFLEMIAAQREAIAARGDHRQAALLFIDLDGFKAVNDEFGHDEGDKVLTQTATILRGLIRESDVAARFGGDEFVVCVVAPADAIAATAVSISGRIVEQVAAIGHAIGCSIGIAFWGDQCPDVSCAMRRADEAMYEAKRRGKNRYAMFGADSKTDGSDWTMAAPRDCGDGRDCLPDLRQPHAG